jgi:hypothetical protein
MALPVLSSNSPSEGFISWTEFNITYAGATYIVPAGNTDQAFVWWQYNGGAPTLQATEALPTDMSDDDLLIFMNVQGAAINAQRTTFMNGALIMDGTITAEAIAAGAITADTVGAGNLTGDYALLGSLNVGEAISLNDTDGLTITQPADGSIQFPADGSAANISSHLDAFSLTVRDRLSVRGTLNEISTGAVVGLSSGVTAPSAPPAVVNTWPQTHVDFWAGHEESTQGIYRYDADTWIATTLEPNQPKIMLASAADGTPLADYDLDPDFVPNGGITAIGSTVYVLGWDKGRDMRIFVKRYSIDPSFSYLGEWEFDYDMGSSNQPAIGRSFDGTEILIARCNSNGRLRIRHFAPDTGTYNGYFISDDSPAISPTGVIQEEGGFYYRLGSYSEGEILTYYANPNFTNTIERTTGFEAAAGKIVYGFSWDPIEERFCSLDNLGTIRHYADPTLGADAHDVAYSYFDSDSTGGLHETARGPVKEITRRRGAFLQVTCSPPNDTGGTDDPDSVRIWIDGYRQADLGTGVMTAIYETPSQGSTTKAANFPAASTPAEFRSGASDTNGHLIRLNGDGSGRIGPYEWDSTGAWIPKPAIKLEPTMPRSGSNFYIKEISPGVVAASGHVDVDDSDSTRRDTGMRIPVGMRPISQVIVSAPIVGQPGAYRYFFNPDGVIEFQQEAGPSGPYEGIVAIWFTA